MQLVILSFIFFASVLGSSSANAFDAQVNSRQYTCTQMGQILTNQGSIWVKGDSGWFNITRKPYSPVCNNGSLNWAGDNCQFYKGRVRTRDGICQFGIQCICNPSNGNRVGSASNRGGYYAGNNGYGSNGSSGYNKAGNNGRRGGDGVSPGRSSVDVGGNRDHGYPGGRGAGGSAGGAGRGDRNGGGNSGGGGSAGNGDHGHPGGTRN